MKPRVYHQYTAWLLVLCAAMACSASSRVLHIYNNHGLDRHRRDSPQQATPHAATGSTRKLSKDLLEYLKHDDSFPALSIYDTKTRALRQVQKRGRRRKRVFVDAISTSVGGAGDSSGTKGKGIRKKKKGGKSGLVGKGKGKGKSKSKSKGGSKKNSKVCKGLDFGDFYGVSGKSKESKTVKKRQLVLDRSLQLGGENCSPNILEVAQMNPNLSIFVELIMHANLEGIFMCAGPFTVLAPSNAAFLKNPSLLQSLLNPRNMEALQELLLYHIVPGLFLSADLVPGPLQTLLGEDVNVSLNPLMFNQAGVTTSDIMGCNGVIDIINDVLIPPNSPVLPAICQMLDFRQPGQFPVMSPKDSIFHRYLETTSFEAADHRQLQFQGERCNPNVFDVASKNPDLSTFVQLLKAAGLEDIFKCAGPFTLLAPTNEAFSTLDPHMLAELLRPGNQKLLQELLLYHILPGFQPSSQLQAGSTETLLYNSNVTVGLNPIMFNDANVVMPDIMACNGVIYTIDQVLVPMKSNICDAFTFGNSTRRSLQNGGMNCTQNVLQTAEQNPELTTIVSLIKAAGLEDIFSCAGPFTALLPDNAAFNKLDPAFIQFLMDPANHNYLQDLLLYHILPGATMSSKFQPGPTATLLLGETVNVTKSPLMFNDAGVTTPDIVACNGYIDIINTVLLPFAAPTAAPTAAPILAPTTAPTSSICANYTFPVVRFRKLQKGGANCTTNVLDTARLNPDLSIVTMLIDIAGLAPIFNCAGPFTALFPTNEAINALDPTFIASLTNPANVNELRNVLLYHVLPGATLSTQFTVGPSNTLFTGNQVNVTLSPLLFNGVGVNKTDVTACNGYIDILNGVLNPFQIIAAPTSAPSKAPISGTAVPVAATAAPSKAPIVGTAVPVAATTTPSVSPSAVPTFSPSVTPSSAPVVGTKAPTVRTNAPSDSPSRAPIPLSPTTMPVKTVRVSDYFISYVAPNATREPTQAEYQEMNNRTAAYFSTFFQSYYNNTNITFLGTTSMINFTLFGPPAGKPTSEFNILIDFSFADNTFSQSSMPPSESEMFKIMKQAISPMYILDVVRTFTGTPFESTKVVYFANSQKMFPAPAPAPVSAPV